jgi:hypothetical protein
MFGPRGSYKRQWIREFEESEISLRFVRDSSQIFIRQTSSRSSSMCELL